MAEMQLQPSSPHRPRRLRGIVVSTSMTKTAAVRVERLFRHPKLQRVIRRHRKLLAHNEENAAHVGDGVVIEETRPLSRRKRWTIAEVVSRGHEQTDDVSADEGGEA